MEEFFFDTNLVITFLVGIAVLSFFYHQNVSKSSSKNRSKPVDPAKHEDLLSKRLAAYTSAPLVESLTEFDKLNLENVNSNQIVSKPDRMIKILTKQGEKEFLNFGSVDFLGAATDSAITGKLAIDALNHYGVGSCGPRSFYGSFDVHLILEKTLADWFGTEGAIVYSDSFATIPGVLGAFVEKQDIIIADEGVNQSIRNGVQLCRATVVYYKHCDSQDARLKFEQVMRTKKKGQRLFLVSEAVFRGTGRVCELKGLIKLREKYKARFLLDESFSIGVLGKTGRGLWEEEEVAVESIDFLCASLDNAFATVGGFCASNQVIKTHQRLAGAGYIFSAAVAPVLSVTATASINRLIDSNRPELNREESLSSQLRKIIRYFHAKFGRNDTLKQRFELVSSNMSPICHVCLKGEESKLEAYRKVRHVCKQVQEMGIFIVATAQTPHEQQEEWLKPTIKLAFSVKQSFEDIEALLKALERVSL